MGQHADDYNDLQIQSIEDSLSYQMGQMTEQEAYEKGVLNEFGELPTGSPVWGVHDANSLANELELIDGMFAKVELRRLRKERSEQVWCSGGKIFRPKDMTTLHLINAIKYAERNGEGDEPVVEQMREELELRSLSKT
jgi:hypothetical protein